MESKTDEEAGLQLAMVRRLAATSPTSLTSLMSQLASMQQGEPARNCRKRSRFFAISIPIPFAKPIRASAQTETPQRWSCRMHSRQLCTSPSCPARRVFHSSRQP